MPFRADVAAGAAARALGAVRVTAAHPPAPSQPHRRRRRQAKRTTGVEPATFGLGNIAGVLGQIG
jgi:hypothetical protein